MTKDELVEIVKRIHAAHSKQIMKAEESHTYRAWWDILGHLDESTVWEAYVGGAATRKWLPTPGEILSTVVDDLLGGFPTPLQAWGQFQDQVRAANAGIQSNTRPHSTVMETVKRLGDEAYRLGERDRQAFIAEWEAVRDGLIREQAERMTPRKLIAVDDDPATVIQFPITPTVVDEK